MILATRRFLLRDFTAADAAAFAALRGGPPAEAASLLDRFIIWSQAVPRQNWQLAAMTRDGDLVGTVGLRGAGLPPDEAEFGIEIAPAWRGRHGVALELARGLGWHGFGPLGLRRIRAETTEDNAAAIRLAEHLGFVFARDASRPAAPGRPLHGSLDGPAWLCAFVATQPAMMAALRVVAAQAPPRSWIGAGFLRNAVWDALHGRAPDVAGLADLDVVFHDPADATPNRDAAAEAALRAAAPSLPWSVTNQARMHGRNGHAPYAGVADAIAHWPETATAIAVRLGPAGVDLLAPHGLDDLFALTVRPTPAFAAQAGVIEARMAAKGWRARWPRLRVDLG